MTLPDTAEFPAPADRPDACIVLYDGECNFCRAQMERLSRWDRDGRLAYVSIHDPMVANRWPDLPHERLLREMCVLERTGQHADDLGNTPRRSSLQPPPKRHWGADAVRYLSRRLPRLWWLAPLLHVPGAMLLARPAYRLVARNRYLLGGKRVACESDACSLHR